MTPRPVIFNLVLGLCVAGLGSGCTQVSLTPEVRRITETTLPLDKSKHRPLATGNRSGSTWGEAPAPSENTSENKIRLASEEREAGNNFPSANQDALKKFEKFLPPEPIPGMSAPEGFSELRLDDVVSSIESHYPLLIAALQEQGISSGQLVAAQGAFDLNLRGREAGQLGTYPSQRITMGVDQNTAWNGVSFFAGYRQSAGDFPIYYGDRKTGDGGEFRAGLSIPLLAGREIDRRRTTLAQAEINRALADPTIAAQRLDFVRAGSRAYWTWVAVGLRYRIAKSVLKIAADRDGQLAELVERGALAQIERTDNKRVIVERETRLVAAERAWQQASIALSLYLRTSEGEPRVPSALTLPQSIPEPLPFDRSVLPRDLISALQNRPELMRLDLQRRRTALELDLARNQLMPNLNLGIEGYQDVGYGSNFSKTPLVTGTALDRSAYVASLQLDVPLQRRDAKGKIFTAESSLAQITAQEKFARERISAELQDAASALERAHELRQKTRENVKVARAVELGEREKFLRGQGTIVILNLRELVTAEASLSEVDALAEYQRALADYRAALAVGWNAALQPVPELPVE